MAIDIYRLEGGKAVEFLYQIDDALYRELEPVLEIYRQQTGLWIDQYASTKLSGGLDALLSAFTKQMSAYPYSLNEAAFDFHRNLVEWKHRGINLIFEGD